MPTPKPPLALHSGHFYGKNQHFATAHDHPSMSNEDLDIRIKTGPKDMEGEKFTVDLVKAVPDGTLTPSQQKGFSTAWEVVQAVAEAEDGEEAAAIMAIGLAISYGVVRLVNRVKSANNTVILFASLNPDIEIEFLDLDIDKGDLAKGLSKGDIKDTTLRVKTSYTQGLMFSTFGRSWGHITGRLVIKGKPAENFRLDYENPLGPRQDKSTYKLLRPNPNIPWTAGFTKRGVISLEPNDKNKNRQDIVSVIFT